MTPHQLYFNSDIKKMIDISPLMLIFTEESHVLIFRRLIERSMTVGLWFGKMAQVS